MRYRLPEGCTGVTHAGLSLEAAADGTVEAEDIAASALAPHGIVPVKADDLVGKTIFGRSKADDRRLLR